MIYSVIGKNGRIVSCDLYSFDDYYLCSILELRGIVFRSEMHDIDFIIDMDFNFKEYKGKYHFEVVRRHIRDYKIDMINDV
jgi:hypothetical protein